MCDVIHKVKSVYVLARSMHRIIDWLGYSGPFSNVKIFNINNIIVDSEFLDAHGEIHKKIKFIASK